ncbi:MAG TPA: cytochrome P450, partial [Vicinamibacterales bacterium]|nr:cytochrome P450 [Vicinamibacterales bacterium]
MAIAAPPGPKISLLGSLIYRPGRDPLAFFTNLAREYGDLVSYRMGGEQIFFVNDPQHVRDILVTHSRNFTKSRGLERTKRLLGNGLLTSE